MRPSDRCTAQARDNRDANNPPFYARGSSSPPLYHPINEESRHLYFTAAAVVTEQLKDFLVLFLRSGGFPPPAVRCCCCSRGRCCTAAHQNEPAIITKKLCYRRRRRRAAAMAVAGRPSGADATPGVSKIPLFYYVYYGITPPQRGGCALKRSLRVSAGSVASPPGGISLLHHHGRTSGNTPPRFWGPASP